MVERRGCPSFTLKAGQSLGVSCHFIGKELERYKTLEATVLGLVDHAHTAPAELFNDAVMRDSLDDHVVDALRDAILGTRPVEVKVYLCGLRLFMRQFCAKPEE